MLEIKFRVPIKANAQIYANKNSEVEEIMQAIKDEINNWDIEDFDELELEIDYQSMEEVDSEGWL